MVPVLLATRLDVGALRDLDIEPEDLRLEAMVMVLLELRRCDVAVDCLLKTEEATAVEELLSLLRSDFVCD